MSVAGHPSNLVKRDAFTSTRPSFNQLERLTTRPWPAQASSMANSVKSSPELSQHCIIQPNYGHQNVVRDFLYAGSYPVSPSIESHLTRVIIDRSKIKKRIPASNTTSHEQLSVTIVLPGDDAETSKSACLYCLTIQHLAPRQRRRQRLHPPSYQQPNQRKILIPECHTD